MPNATDEHARRIGSKGQFENVTYVGMRQPRPIALRPPPVEVRAGKRPAALTVGATFRVESNRYSSKDATCPRRATLPDVGCVLRVATRGEVLSCRGRFGKRCDCLATPTLKAELSSLNRLARTDFEDSALFV